MLNVLRKVSTVLHHESFVEFLGCINTHEADLTRRHHLNNVEIEFLNFSNFVWWKNQGEPVIVVKNILDAGEVDEVIITLTFFLWKNALTSTKNKHFVTHGLEIFLHNFDDI